MCFAANARFGGGTLRQRWFPLSVSSSVQTREPHDELVDAVLKILVCECDLCNCILSASALMAHDHISFCSGASVWTTCYAPVGYAILNPQIEASWTVFD